MYTVLTVCARHVSQELCNLRELGLTRRAPRDVRCKALGNRTLNYTRGHACLIISTGPSTSILLASDTFVSSCCSCFGDGGGGGTGVIETSLLICG